jgi:hypothetical protein
MQYIKSVKIKIINKNVGFFILKDKPPGNT